MISPPQPSVCSQLSHNLFICLGGFIKCCSTYPYRTFNRYKTFYLKKFGLQSSSVPIVVMCLNHGFRNILNQKLRQNILLWLVNGLCKNWHLEFPTSHWLTIVLSYLHHQYIFLEKCEIVGLFYYGVLGPCRKYPVLDTEQRLHNKGKGDPVGKK